MPDGLLQALMPSGWPTFALVSSRVAGLVFVAPLWSMRLVPMSVKGAFAVLITLALVPRVAQADLPAEALGLPVLVAGEIVIGVGMGLVAAFLIHAVMIAGQVVSIQTGLSIAGALNPEMGGVSQGIGELKVFFVLALYLAIGGHIQLLAGLARSLDTIPPGSAFDLVAGGQTLVDIAGSVFVTAVRVAGPVITAVMLTQISLAILGKAVPQINVLMLAFPITISVGLIVIGSSLAVLSATVGDFIHRVPASIDSLVRAFAGGV